MLDTVVSTALRGCIPASLLSDSENNQSLEKVIKLIVLMELESDAARKEKNSCMGKAYVIGKCACVCVCLCVVVGVLAGLDFSR